MATTSAAERKLIRCPVCVATLSIPGDADPLANATCPRCKRVFRVLGALPVKADAEKLRTSGTASTSVSASGSLGTLSLRIIGGVLAAAFLGAYVMRFFQGPEFLACYFIVFCATHSIVSCARWFYRDEWSFTIYGLLLFEGMGIARIFTSSHPGVKKYEFLVMGMIFGGLLFLLRAKSDGSGYGVLGHCSSGSSSGCGSGCGGGGCGGGGCGG